MKIGDLGPLEQSILHAVVHAELLGTALDVRLLWRTLPHYETSLANVEAALAEGAALHGWVREVGGLFACLDREHIPHGMVGARRRAEGRWARVAPFLRGLGKLPYVESVAVVGSGAWGVLDDVVRPLELAVIAEPGRVALARAALAAWRRARGEIGAQLRISVVLDEADLGLPDPGLPLALAFLPLSPVVDAVGWTAWRAANPWLASTFPNWDPSAAELPDHVLSERRDGRLAALRRRASRRLRRVEDVLQDRVPGRDPGLATVVPPEFEALFAARWADLASWEVAEPVIPEPPRLGASPAPPARRVASAPIAPAPVASAPVASAPVASAPAQPATSAGAGAIGSRRSRAPERRPRRSRRSASSPDRARTGCQ